MLMPTSKEYDKAKEEFEHLYQRMKDFNSALKKCEQAGLTIHIKQVSSEVRGGQTVHTGLEITWEFSDSVR